MTACSFWPAGPKSRRNTPLKPKNAQMEGLMEIIRAIRNLRSEMNVAGRQAHACDAHAPMRAGRARSRLQSALYCSAWLTPATWPSAARMRWQAKRWSAPYVPRGEIRIPLGDLVDLQKELARLEKERKNLEGEIARAQGKLNNPGFLSKAPAQLVEQEREKLKTAQSMLESPGCAHRGPETGMITDCGPGNRPAQAVLERGAFLAPVGRSRRSLLLCCGTGLGTPPHTPARA